MPDQQRHQQQGALTPLERAYQTDRGGFQSLIGVVQQRIDTRRKIRLMDEELDRRQQAVTYQIEEQDRVRRAYYHDIEEPRFEAERTLQEAQLEEQQRQNIAETIQQKIDTAKDRLNKEVREKYASLTQLPQFTVPDTFQVGPDGQVYVMMRDLHNPEDEQRARIVSVDDYLLRLSRFAPVSEFIREYQERLPEINPGEPRDDIGHHGNLLNRAAAMDLVSRLHAGEATAEELQHIRNGFTRLDIRSDEADARNFEKGLQSINGAFADLKVVLGDDLVAEGRTGVGWGPAKLWNKGEPYEINPRTQTVGEMVKMIRMAIREGDIDPQSVHPGIALLDYIRVISQELAKMNYSVNLDNVYFNFNRNRYETPKDLFLDSPVKVEEENEITTTGRGSTSHSAARSAIRQNFAPGVFDPKLYK